MITRSLWVFVHRWAGLAMAAFLIVVGLTGSMLAFFGELNHWLSPELFPEPRPGVHLDAGTLARRAEALVPEARTTSVYLGFAGTAMVRMEPRPGAARNLDFQQMMLDPIDGHELGRRAVGGLPTSLATVIPFVYQLHMNLLLGPTGVWILGIVALVWTLDCFVGFYLTLPVPSRAARNGFFARWRVAWRVKWPASSYRLNFDLHRAGGLWLWAMLLVFAWSSVYFHLNGVYVAATKLLLAYEEPFMNHEAAPAPALKDRKALEWEEAQAIGARLMEEQARSHDFTVDRPNALSYMRARALWLQRAFEPRHRREIRRDHGILRRLFGGVSRPWSPQRRTRRQYADILARGAPHGQSIRSSIQDFRLRARLRHHDAVGHGRLYLAAQAARAKERGHAGARRSRAERRRRTSAGGVIVA
jgi:uncharacterized iron-regulated membrane protein